MTRAKRLRIYVGEAERHHGRPLYRAMVEAARAAGLAGATVVRGIEGYGPKHGLQTAHVVDLSADLPVVVEIVDDAARIEAFLPTVKAMLGSGLVTVEDVDAAFGGSLGGQGAQ